jgi:2-(1,2-epoxy-1,2-dihydrophenyl)acetyl-CoA isomerase
MAFEAIRLEKQGAIATITLNRPDRLNAMTWRMVEEIIEAEADCYYDDAIRVVVITGAGRAFCSGDDIVGGMGERGPRNNPDAINADRGFHHRMLKNLMELPKPVVAALNGRCHGAGWVLSLACDFRVGHSDVVVGDIRSGRSIFPSQGSALLLPRLIGQSRAMDLTMTGRVIDAVEAERIGYLNRLWPAATWEAELAAFLDDLASGPTKNYGAVKLAVNRAVLREFDEYSDYDRYLANQVRATEDAAEGRSSFREKRPARYVGR